MTSEAHKRANKKWKDNNKDKQRVYQYRSYARSYITKMATAEDLDELVKLIDERRKELKVSDSND